MRTRTFWTISLAGAFGLPTALALGDVVLGPPSGAWHVLLWPVDVLLWATGPGVPLSNGSFEWTPVQDFAVWLGIGCSWLFWMSAVCLVSRLCVGSWRRGQTAWLAATTIGTDSFSERRSHAFCGPRAATCRL